MIIELRRNAPRERDVGLHRLRHEVRPAFRLDRRLDRVQRRQLGVGPQAKPDPTHPNLARAARGSPLLAHALIVPSTKRQRAFHAQAPTPTRECSPLSVDVSVESEDFPASELVRTD